MSATRASTTSAIDNTPLPLTTTFTPPESCVSDFWLGSTIAETWKTWMNLGPIRHPECLPSGWKKGDFFSPGICPTGYAIANTVIDLGSPNQTKATCCPVLDEFTFSTRPSDIGSTKSESIDCVWSPGPGVQTTITATWTTNGSTSTQEAVLSSKDHINAYGVYIQWASTDSITPVSNTAATTTTPTAATSSEIYTASDSPSSAGLSTGAKAGVGVGVAVGAILVIAALALLFFRRRRSQSAQYQQSSGGDTGAMRLAGHPLSEMSTGHAEYSELTSSQKPFAELPAEAALQELEGSRK